MPPHVQRSTRLEGDEPGGGGPDPEVTRKLDRHVPDERTELVATGASGGTADADRQDKKASPSNGLPVWLIGGGAVLAVLLLVIFLAARQGTPGGSGIVPASVPTPAAMIGSTTPVEMPVIKPSLRITGTKGLALAISPDGNDVTDGRQVWDLHTGKLVRTLHYDPSDFDDLGNGSVDYAAFSPDPSVIATVRYARSGDDRFLILFGKNDNSEKIIDKNKGSLFWFLFSPSGDRLLFIHNSDKNPGYNTVKLYNVSNRKLVSTIELPSASGPFFYRPDGKIVAITPDPQSASLRQMAILDPETLQQIQTYPLVFGEVWGTGEAASPNGLLLLTCRKDDPAFAVYNTQSGALLTPLIRASTNAGDVAISPDGKWIAASFRSIYKDQNGVIRQPASFKNFDAYPRFDVMDDAIVGIWSAKSGRQLALLGDGGGAGGTRFTSDGKMIVATSIQAINVWRLPQDLPVE